MQYSIKTASPETIKTDVLVVSIFEGGILSESATAIDQATHNKLSALIKSGDINTKLGHCRVLFDIAGLKAPRLVVLGLGKAADLSINTFKQALHGVAHCLLDIGAHNATLSLLDVSVTPLSLTDKTRTAVEALGSAFYQFNEFKSTPSTARQLTELFFLAANPSDVAAMEKGLKIGQALVSGMNCARDLGNRPGNVLVPATLAEEAKKLAKVHSKRMKCKILDQADMQKLGMGALLAVAQGSVQPPKLIVLEYHNDDEQEAPIALIGKGVTFDSGGISIKPSDGMDEMKYDMCGAASVLGTLTALAELEAKINVVAIIPAVENMPSGSAARPGDIVKTLSGQTVEILNTDAEGRLILCDALTYAAQFKPKAMIDIATLTGAIVVALGRHPHGLFANDDVVANALLAAGDKTGDRAWRMPVWEDYQSQLDSNFADMTNIGGREGGACTAAAFLARFTKDYRWAHLDIAATAWKSGKEKGATGRPVPLLLAFLLDHAKS